MEANQSSGSSLTTVPAAKDSRNETGEYSIISLPFLHTTTQQQATQAGCTINGNIFTGTPAQIEAFMTLQNPMFQVKYNQRQYLNGRWNMVRRKMEGALPLFDTGSKIIMSVSAVQGQKTTSTGFHPIGYDNFQQVAEAMHIFAHSPSIYSPILKWDEYQNTMKWDYRRRLHNISFIGNILAYDFDDGSLTLEQAGEIAKSIGMDALVIKSKSDPKYPHDRFKMLFKTDLMYPAYDKDPVAPSFQKQLFTKYKTIYTGFAKKHGLWEFMDKNTNDASRLIARVTNTDDERREYVTY